MVFLCDLMFSLRAAPLRETLFWGFVWNLVFSCLGFVRATREVTALRFGISLFLFVWTSFLIPRGAIILFVVFLRVEMFSLNQTLFFPSRSDNILMVFLCDLCFPFAGFLRFGFLCGLRAFAVKLYFGVFSSVISVPSVVILLSEYLL